ncbi:MAG: hypothetical protein ACR2Q4_08320 [Geminicoccaceae bacterium]
MHDKDSDIGTLVLGIVMAVLSLFGLAMASNAKDDVFYGTGLGLFLFCVLFIFVLIHQRTGR